MTDIMDAATRSRLMARVRATDTKPEIALRRALFALGFRYRLYRKDLPGKPDIVLPKYHAVIFIHGCFWHGHDCELFRLPKTRPEFWRAKIEANRERDARNRARLQEAGWRSLEIWECAMRGQGRWDFEQLVRAVRDWLVSNHDSTQVHGRT
jgi:DNA mismatch endonuclease (patch repair protein)